MEGYKDSMKKKEKKRRPAKVKKKREHYEPLKPIFGKADDYQIYKMSLLEKLIGTGIGFGAGFLICMVFFRNLPVSVLIGAAIAIPVCRKYQEYLKKKRQKNLLLQFKDMMEALTSSYSTGKNTPEAFRMLI